MKKNVKRICACFMALLMIIMPCGCGKSLDSMINQTAGSLQKAFQSDKKYVLEDESVLPAGSSASDWIAMTLAFSGRKNAYDEYLSRLNQYVARKYREDGCLSDVKATEYHRVALTMLALGGNPRKVEEDGQSIDLIADGTWDFCGGSPGTQGSNGLIYALIILNASENFAKPDTENELINELLTYQQEDGAFCIDNSLGGDIDITAMAVQALAPYSEDQNVKNVTDKALEWLEKQLTEDMVFCCFGSDSAETSAQVILALCALGRDPDTDELFQKDGKNLLDGLEQFRLRNGMYCHSTSDSEEDTMATYQALLALEAVRQLRNDGTWILDFDGYQSPESA